jgi:hypothetical protein
LGTFLKNGIPYVKHTPVIFEAESIEESKTNACKAADIHCPKSQFSRRNVVVDAIPAESYKELLSIAQPLAETTWPKEDAISFNCDGIGLEDKQNITPDIIILEFDKPAS